MPEQEIPEQEIPEQEIPEQEIPEQEIPEQEIPEQANPDARESWPRPGPVGSSRRGWGFELRPGEDVALARDDPGAMAAARRFRDVLGQFPSGVTVVTALNGDEPVGMTCQSFASVSLNPPLVLFCPAKSSRAWPVIQRSGSFCVNFLSQHQAGIANLMASKGVDKFAGVDWERAAATDSPVLTGSLGHLDCTLETVVEAGDHYVAIGRVRDLVATGEAQPLLFFRGRYGRPAR